MLSIEQVLKDLTDKAAQEINKQKEGVIKSKLKEHKLLYKLKHSKERRFKKIMIEEDEKYQHVFVDNNTINGLRVVSFLKEEPKIEDGKLTFELKYY